MTGAVFAALSPLSCYQVAPRPLYQGNRFAALSRPRAYFLFGGGGAGVGSAPAGFPWPASLIDAAIIARPTNFVHPPPNPSPRFLHKWFGGVRRPCLYARAYTRV